MAANKLSPDATIEGVLKTLRNPEAYLVGVLSNMIPCKRQHSSAVVRIGTKGEGYFPHYRVEPSESRLAVLEREILAVTSEEARRHSAHRLASYFNAYRGTSHKRLDWGHNELQEESWSSKSTTIDQVQELLGQVRGYKPKRK